MIVRVQGSGQYRLAEPEVRALDRLDDQLVQSVHNQNTERVHQLLGEMIALVQTKGAPVADDELAVSDTVLPPDTLSVKEVETLLQHEGLIEAATATS